MRTVPVNAEHAYQVEIGVEWRIALQDWIEGRNQILVIASEKFPVDTPYPTLLVPDGEFGKNIQVAEKLWIELGERDFGRKDLLIAVGGGAVTDLAGFIAATWMRGIDWLAIPTTVAGMVDAAIGGKTGLNLKAGKNLIGSFHSPVSVLVDLSFTETLSERDFAAGLAEVVKCGFISDSEILKLLNGKSLKDVMNDKQLLSDLVHRSVSVKASVVSQDFKESSLREILNYGHTLGHAVEAHSNYLLRHGEAVSIGMCFAAELAKEKLGLSQEIVDLHYKLLNSLKLPTSYQSASWNDLEVIMRRDKKSKDGRHRFVGINKVSSCERIEGVSSSDLQSIYERISK